MKKDYQFVGPLPAPDFTMIPDMVFDEILPHVDGGEAKVLFYLLRETYGWHRPSVRLTLPAICAGAGVSRRTAAEALKAFEAQGMIGIDRTTGRSGKESNTYTVLLTTSRKYISYTSDRQKVDDQGRIENSRPTSSCTEKKTENGASPAKTENAVWAAVLAELRLVLTAENYNTWLAETTVVCQEGTQLTIAVTQPFHKEWIEAKLWGRIQSTMQRLGFGDITLTLVVD